MAVDVIHLLLQSLLFLSGSDQKENVDLNIQSEGAFLNKG